MTPFQFEFARVALTEDPAVVVLPAIADADGAAYDFGDDGFDLAIGGRRIDDAVPEPWFTLALDDEEIAWEIVSVGGAAATQFTFMIPAAKLALLPAAGTYVGDLFRIAGEARTRFARVILPVEGGVSA